MKETELSVFDSLDPWTDAMYCVSCMEEVSLRGTDTSGVNGFKVTMMYTGTCGVEFLVKFPETGTIIVDKTKKCNNALE